jgi:DNA-binding MarR family transcriptional regulator
MSSKTVGTGSGDARRKRRLIAAVRDQLRAVSVQLSLLNHQVSGRLALKASDLGCLDLLAQHGPQSPGALARLAGLHPATLTGVLDRLERAGWVVRGRDPADRRGVVITALRDRGGEVFALFAGMNGRMDRICADYDEAQLELLADFLRRTAEAGQLSTDELASG